MTSPAERPNLYEVLGLDPNRPHATVDLQRALNDAVALWSRLKTGIQGLAQTDEARQNHRYGTEFRQIIADPDQLIAERAKAQALQVATMLTRRRELDELLILMLARGYLLDTEVSAIKRDFADILASDADLARRLAAAEVRTARVNHLAARLPTEQEDRLRKELAALGSASLYDVLHAADESVTPHSPLAALQTAAEALYRQAHTIMDKTNPTVTARQRLSGLAKTVFKTEEGRRRHDVSMGLETLHKIVVWYERALANANEVSAEQFALFLERARTEGFDDLDQARDYFLAHFGSRRWSVQLPAVDVGSTLGQRVQCPRCAQLNEPGVVACVRCAFDLMEPCPNCGLVQPRYGGCQCGFPVGQRERVEELVAQAKAALEQHDWTLAEVPLSRAARMWVLPPDRSDRIIDEIRAAQTRLTQGRHAIETTTRAVEQALAERRFLTAAQLLRLAPADLPRREMLLAQADRAVRNARQRYQMAREPGIAAARRVELHLEALRVCDDFEPARTELGRIPPDPPGDVRVSVGDPDVGVLIRWEPSAEPDVSYVVVRATGGRIPETADDVPGQQRIVTSKATGFRDRAVGEAGSVLRYAVFVNRSGVLSTPGVSPPIVLAVDPSLRAVASDGTVVLTWSLPEHAVRLELQRQEMHESAPPATLAVDTTAGRHVDTDVRNGRRYHYTVRAAYANLAGGLVWSGGRRAQATPSARPTPAGPLTINGHDADVGFYIHKVQIRWPPPERGIVKVLRYAGAGPVREDDQWPDANLGRDGHLLDDSGGMPVADLWFEDGVTLRTYIPVLVLDGMCHAGRPRRYVRGPELTDLSGEFTREVVRLGWTWPDTCDEVLIAYDPTTPPVDPTTARAQVSVRRLDNDRIGGCDLPGSAIHRLHVTVATVVTRDGADFVSSGVPLRVDRPSVRVSYEVVRPNSRRPELVLLADPAAALPRLVLRAQAGRTPLSRDDGVSLAEVNEGSLPNGRLSVPLQRLADGMQYRLFTASTVDSDAVLLDRA